MKTITIKVRTAVVAAVLAVAVPYVAGWIVGWQHGLEEAQGWETKQINLLLKKSINEGRPFRISGMEVKFYPRADGQTAYKVVE